MTVLLILAAVLAVVGAYVAGVEFRAARASRDGGWHLFDGHVEPARDRSLDASSPSCSHATRPAAVVPYAHNEPVAWVCPDCDAVVSTPPPLGPEPDPETRGPGARSDRDTASSLPGTVSTGSTTINATSITADRITVSAVMSSPEAQRAYDARVAYLDRETVEIHSHGSATPVRTLSTSSITYANAEADAALHRRNLTALLDHGGISPSEVRGALAHYDRHTGRGWPIDPTDDTRPL